MTFQTLHTLPRMPTPPHLHCPGPTVQLEQNLLIAQHPAHVDAFSELPHN